MISVVVPSYAPPVSYMAWLINQERIYWLIDSHYKKQTYRNRAYIYGANGRLSLIIPVRHTPWRQHQKENEVQTDNDVQWQKLHWKSLQVAYRSSPFFEFYEDALAPLYRTQTARLYEFNRSLLNVLFDLLEIKLPQEEVSLDFSYHQLNESLLNAKKETPLYTPYAQVFDSKYGFLNNLSTLDLLFNLGPEAKTYLQQCPN